MKNFGELEYDKVIISFCAKINNFHFKGGKIQSG